MIVEFYGPPGAGKTTLAHLLLAALRARGHCTDLRLSARPAEAFGDQGDAPVACIRAAASRFGRPAAEFTQLMRGAFIGDLRISASLLGIMRPNSVIWSVRLAQYLMRLSHHWRQASRSPRIVVFDQAFVQAVCSLTLLASRSDDARIASALTAVPQSDVLVRIIAPEDVLRERLRKRELRQGLIERHLELSLVANLEAIQITDRIDQILKQHDRRLILACSDNEATIRHCITEIESRIEATTVAPAADLELKVPT